MTIILDRVCYLDRSDYSVHWVERWSAEGSAELFRRSRIHSP